jgi:hypothetical protein
MRGMVYFWFGLVVFFGLVALGRIAGPEPVAGPIFSTGSIGRDLAESSYEVAPASAEARALVLAVELRRARAEVEELRSRLLAMEENR